MCRRLLTCCLLAACAAAQDVALQAPLTTAVPCPDWVPGRDLEAVIEVPANAPADLGAGAFVLARNGRWFQARGNRTLSPGTNRLRFALGPDARLVASGAPCAWTAAVAAGCDRAGIVLWSAGAARTRVTATLSAVEPAPAAMATARLTDLRCDGAGRGTLIGSTREMWSFSLMPAPFPAHAGDPAEFRLEAEITEPDGHGERIAGFYEPPRVAAGDDDAVPAEVAGRFVLRFLPRLSGAHRVRLMARWADGSSVDTELPSLTVLGPPRAATTRIERLPLQAPMTTVVPCPDFAPGRDLEAVVLVSADAPSDLGVGVFVADAEGRWFQRAGTALRPGANRLRFDLSPTAPLRSEGRAAIWGPAASAACRQAGLLLWSATATPSTVAVELSAVDHRTAPKVETTRLIIVGGGLRAATGDDWRLTLLPEPAPSAANDRFPLEAHVGEPGGGELRLAGIAERDADGRPTGRWLVRFRPRRPGPHRLRLSARWEDGNGVESELPPLMVTGVARDIDTVVQHVELAAPLVTIVPCPGFAPGRDLDVALVLPDDAPADLGVAAMVGDRHGRWFQTTAIGRLSRGLNQLRFALDPTAMLSTRGEVRRWNAGEAAGCDRAAVVLWSAQSSRCALDIELATEARPAPAPDAAPRLADLRLDGIAGPSLRAATGRRWSASLVPTPFPGNPYDPAQFTLDLVVRDPDGTTQRIPGFYDQPMRLDDGGDRELASGDGAGRFQVRLRPRRPGVHRLRLEARWGDGRTAAYDLPPLMVTGEPWDGYARVDAGDARFFSVAGRFYWPLGPNLHCISDVRARQYLHTAPIPERGTLSYEAYLDRLAWAGCTGTEIWMSSWNLALEWRGDWNGFHGQGRYNEGNAARLDRILDLAAQRGIRVNLVINNHGQASPQHDPEWAGNPYNVAQGGKLKEAAQFFSDRWALAGQDALRRYLVARYADHPAVLGWKLFTEIDLTSAGGQARAWHDQASARWHALDSYQHPVTTHWCGDYTHPDRSIVALPTLDYVCIDAYHGDETFLPGLLQASTLDPAPQRGLAQCGKPVLVTEFGCNWSAGPPAKMAAELSCAPWVGMVSGHAGSPMLWWIDWLDEGNHWGGFRPVARFLDGEDLRDPRARSVHLTVSGEVGELWGQAWSRKGRMLGYVIDHGWGLHGGEGKVQTEAVVAIGMVPQGAVEVEWWDAEKGILIARGGAAHKGGLLALKAPTFQRQVAFKMVEK